MPVWRARHLVYCRFDVFLNCFIVVFREGDLVMSIQAYAQIKMNSQTEIYAALNIYSMIAKDYSDEYPDFEEDAFTVKADFQNNLVYAFSRSNAVPELMVDFAKNCATDMSLSGITFVRWVQTSNGPGIDEELNGGVTAIDMKTGEIIQQTTLFEYMLDVKNQQAVVQEAPTP